MWSIIMFRLVSGFSRKSEEAEEAEEVARIDRARAAEKYVRQLRAASAWRHAQGREDEHAYVN